MKMLIGVGLMIIALTFGLAMESQAQDTGKWQFHESTDPITDVKSVYIMLASENGPEQSMMIKIDRFIAQIKPYQGNMITATYDVTGLVEAFKPLQAILDSAK